ncbi:hypothetical protein [Massilia eburnea]|uniref:hypothetical protein n=1 Tax=Massilia eburnea TaxID=1776165 RepID=UPI003D6AEC0D
MAKLLHAQILVDGLTTPAYHVLNAAFEHAMNAPADSIHRLPLVDVYKRAHLATRTSRLHFAQIVESAKHATVELDRVDITHPENEAEHIGCWPAFEATAVTDTHFEFTFCRYVRLDRVFFSGYWRSGNGSPQ